MERNMAPMTHNARALLAPGDAPLSREIVPMQPFFVELALGPSRKVAYNIAL